MVFPSPEAIKNLSYTDFIGFIGQTNVPPGSYDTLNRWILHGAVTASAEVIEVACTTGFSLREIARKTGCSGKGFDINSSSIATARHFAGMAGQGERLQWQVADGYTFAAEKRYTHVIVGASLGFFPDPGLMLSRCLSYFGGNEGMLLAAPFYVSKEIPTSLITAAQRELHITPTRDTWQQVSAIYSGLRVEYQQRMVLFQESEQEIELYCHATIERCMGMRNLSDPQLYETMFARLKAIKQICNELRPFQEYAVLVLRYCPEEYPRRYVELF